MGQSLKKSLTGVSTQNRVQPTASGSSDYQLGSARIEVVQLFGCGGMSTFLAPGRGTYGSVWSAAFQRCKKQIGRAHV